MSIIQILAIAAAAFCLCNLLAFFVRIVRLGKPNDLSEKSGSTSAGIKYANTVAMMPQNKESAFLHFPSYASGMLFHIGTFASLLAFVLFFFPFFNTWVSGRGILPMLIAAALAITALCGYGLFLKRAFSKDLRPLSNPDDFISNLLTSTFQLATALFFCCHCQGMSYAYYIASILLFLYLPFGKLRHVVFYFAARYHLGFFYGWRNVWPKNEN